MQNKGYNRAQVQALVINDGLDAHASWLGKQINDKFIGALRMRQADLEGHSMKGAAETLLAVEGADKVFVWKIKLAGDVYERSVGKMSARGSIALLRATYGAKNVHTGNADSMSKLLATKKACKKTLDFYGLASLVKNVTPVKTVKVKGKAKKTAKGKNKPSSKKDSK